METHLTQRRAFNDLISGIFSSFQRLWRVALRPAAIGVCLVSASAPAQAQWSDWSGNWFAGLTSVAPGGLIDPDTLSPTVLARGPFSLDLFARTTTQDNDHNQPAGTLIHRSIPLRQDGSHVLVGTDNLGGQLTSEPSCVAWGVDRMDCFVRGPDNGLWRIGWQGAWGGWEALGGALTSGPSAVSQSPGTLDVFVRGPNNSLWTKAFQAGRWSDWLDLGGALTSSPGCVSPAPQRIDCFVRSADNGLWHRWLADGRWQDWTPRGGLLTSAPEVTSWSAERLDVFVRGPDLAMWHIWVDSGVWSDWENLGGRLASAPSCVAPGFDHIECFAGRDASDNNASFPLGNVMRKFWLGPQAQANGPGGQSGAGGTVNLLPLPQLQGTAPSAPGGSVIVLPGLFPQANQGGQTPTPDLIAQGQTVFSNSCGGCHTAELLITPGSPRTGPGLFGVVGRPAAAITNFRYSSALANSGITWDSANLDRWLADPRGFIPGNRMSFPGLADPTERQAVIAFLQTRS